MQPLGQHLLSAPGCAGCDCEGRAIEMGSNCHASKQQADFWCCMCALVALPQALPDALLDNKQQQRPAAGGADAAGAPLPLHYVELRAPSFIMPWTLHGLLGLLQDSQGLEGFQAYLTTEPCSSSLNVLPELWGAAAAAAAAALAAAGIVGAGEGVQQQQLWRREGRGFAPAEVGSWGVSAVLLHGRVLRQLRLEEGSIAAKLS